MLDLKLKELKQLASTHNINGRSKMNKEQLITELNKIDGGGKPASKSKSRTNKHKSSVAKQSATFKKPKKPQLKPFPNILEVPSEIPWPSSITTIIAKYENKYYTGIVKEKLENGKYLILFDNGSEGEFTKAQIEENKISKCIKLIYDSEPYTGIVTNKTEIERGIQKYVVVFKETGTEVLLTESEIESFEEILKTAKIQTIWNATDKVNNYILTWDQDIVNSKINIIVDVEELFNYLDTPSTIRGPSTPGRFQLWGMKFTQNALNIFNELELAEDNKKVNYDYITKVKGVTYKYMLYQIYKFFNLIKYPEGITDLPDHPGLQQYKMTAQNVRGRPALIGQSGLRINPEFNYYITKGTVLGIYKGTICTKRESDAKEETRSAHEKGYQFTLTKHDPIEGDPGSNFVVDPFYTSSSPKSLLIYANDVARTLNKWSKKNAVFEQNATFAEVDIYGMTYMILIALKDLYPGDEIGVDYGKDYGNNKKKKSVKSCRE